MMAPQIASKNKQIKELDLNVAELNAQPVHISMLKQLKYLAAADSSLLESVGEMETKVNRVFQRIMPILLIWHYCLPVSALLIGDILMIMINLKRQ